MQYKLICDLHKDYCADVHDRGLHYGDGLFETMLLADGEIKYWQEHYERLALSATRLYIGCPDKSWFEQHLQPYTDLQQPLIIKIILTRGSGGRGLQLLDNMPNNVYLLKYEASKIDINQTIRAIISDITLPRNINLAGLKHLNRLDYILATQALKRRNDFNEALLFNSSGYLVETIVNNLFFVKQGTIFTPILDESGVDGIMRQLILNKLKQKGKEVNIGSYTKQDILKADECFVCNSVQGIHAITQIEHTEFNIGPITQELQQIFHGHSGN